MIKKLYTTKDELEEQTRIPLLLLEEEKFICAALKEEMKAMLTTN